MSELVRQMPGHDVLVFDGGASTYDLGNGYLWRARNFAHALWMCLGLRKRYKLFHLHLSPSIYLAIFLGNRAIVHEHSSHYERRKKLLPRVLSKIAMQRAAAIIAVSEAVRRKISDRLGSHAKVVALPNFVVRFSDIKDTSDGPPHLLMVAAFDRPKRQDDLIRALPLLPDDVRVTFAGDGPSLPTCRELARGLGVANRVTFSGSVRDIEKQYANAHLCVLLSDWEGFGLVVLEAAQFGKATVVSDIEGLRDSCPDSRLLCERNNPRDIANKVLAGLTLSQQSEFRAKLRLHADKHDLIFYASRLAEIYGQSELAVEG